MGPPSTAIASKGTGSTTATDAAPPSLNSSAPGLSERPVPASCKGLIGGLRDLDRLRASSCRKGIGEKRGVVASRSEPVGENECIGVAINGSSGGRTGKASIVEVTSSARSKARRYFPALL